MNWTPCRNALPAYGERVLIPANGRVEIAQRVETDHTVPHDHVEHPAFVWELDTGRATYHPRQITHWQSLPSLP
jgi:hypothetical protein